MVLIYKKLVYMIIAILIIFAFSGCLFAGGDSEHIEDNPKAEEDIKDIEKDPVRVKVESMTLEEKIGQMVLAGFEGYGINEGILKMVEDHKVGGFILYSSNIESSKQLLELLNSIRAANSDGIPLFFAVDEEGGRVSRMPEEIEKLPPSQAIGRVDSDELSYGIGSILALELKEFGFNMDFAPVLDINSNPENPVIGDRSFGTDEKVVSRLGIQTMKGIQSGGIIPVVKHFPGHGDTSVDSHKSLPLVNSDLNRLRSFELIPFGEAVSEGADAVMTAHILLPQIDSKNPASLSKNIITGILRKELGFKGVVITDDMTMGAIVNNYDIGEASVQAVNAGVDIILVAHGYDNAVEVSQALRDAAESGEIPGDRIDESVYRVLKLKSKYGIDNSLKNPADIDKINNEIQALLDKFF